MIASQIKSATKDIKDGNGLQLQSQSEERGGQELAACRVSPPCGRQREMGLGSASKVTLAQARALFEDARHMVRQGSRGRIFISQEEPAQ